MPSPLNPGDELEAVLSDRAFLRRLARSRIADEHRAEDVVQEAWVRALERGPAEVGAARNSSEADRLTQLRTTSSSAPMDCSPFKRGYSSWE